MCPQLTVLIIMCQVDHACGACTLIDWGASLCQSGYQHDMAFHKAVCRLVSECIASYELKTAVSMHLN